KPRIGNNPSANRAIPVGWTKKGGQARAPVLRWNVVERLEVNANAELEQALLALARVARERVGGARRIECRAVLGVRHVERLDDQLEARGTHEPEVLAEAKIELRERRTALVIDVAVSRREILV